jgi:membrane protease subunit HflC
MGMNMKIRYAIVAVLALVLLRSALFTVDRTEYVYLTQFGRHVAPTYDGADDAQAGLHLKWPWPIQAVQRLDRRLQFFDLPGAELLTRDPKRNTIDKTLTLDAYVCWRIADAQTVDAFIRTVGSAEGARAVLGQRINSELGAAIGGLELDDLVSTEPGKVDAEREKLRQQLLVKSGLQQTARAEYGIEVVDIRLRRINHPPTVQRAIFDRIVSERNKKAAEYESEGRLRAAEIESASQRRVTELKAEAEGKAIEVRGRADAAADRIRNEAQAKDPQFYAFLKKLEEYQRFLGDNKTLLLLSTHRELFDVLFQPPGSGPKPEK